MQMVGAIGDLVEDCGLEQVARELDKIEEAIREAETNLSRTHAKADDVAAKVQELASQWVELDKSSVKQLSLIKADTKSRNEAEAAVWKMLSVGEDKCAVLYDEDRLVNLRLKLRALDGRISAGYGNLATIRKSELELQDRVFRLNDACGKYMQTCKELEARLAKLKAERAKLKVRRDELEERWSL